MRLFVRRYHTDNPALGLRCLEKSPGSHGRWNGAIGLVEQPAVLGERVSRVAALPRKCHSYGFFYYGGTGHGLGHGPDIRG